MAGNGLRLCRIVGLAVISLAFLRSHSDAVFLDKDGNIKLGLRTYVNARIGTEHTDSFVRLGTTGTQVVTAQRSRTFPVSPAGHLRQNRFFIEAELKHDLDSLLKQGIGPLSLLNDLPFRIRRLGYGLTYRGEGDGLYDWGPREFRTAAQYEVCGSPLTGELIRCVNRNPATNTPVNVPVVRKNLRDRATHRSRLFQAYLEADVGRFFFRFGRQILSWGETDGFRLLDNINPLDSSFGGFLISLDERRVPLDMLRVQYRVGSLGPISDAFIEMYGAIDNKVGFYPGTPAGSAWGLPNNGAPSQNSRSFIVRPSRTFGDMRGGGRLVWNMFDATFSLAHYYTYVDTPALQFFVKPEYPSPINPQDPDLSNSSFPEGYSVHIFQTAPHVQVSGASTTFAVPSLYTVVRSEIAYFKGEPRFRQRELDPFIFHLQDANGNDPQDPRQRTEFPVTGGRRLGDSINFVLGFDVNQYIRALNPYQTFFFSTQFFYKHLVHAHAREPVAGRFVIDGEVLPVVERDYFLGVPGSRYGRSLGPFGALEPSFIKHPTDQFLHTLFITTAFRSGTVIPGFLFFYDWGGGLVYQPSLTLSYDPFRFTVDYSILDAGSYKAGSGVSLLRDRDNVQFRLEYVI